MKKNIRRNINIPKSQFGGFSVSNPFENMIGGWNDFWREGNYFNQSPDSPYNFSSIVEKNATLQKEISNRNKRIKEIEDRLPSLDPNNPDNLIQHGPIPRGPYQSTYTYYELQDELKNLQEMPKISDEYKKDFANTTTGVITGMNYINSYTPPAQILPQKGHMGVSYAQYGTDIDNNDIQNYNNRLRNAINVGYNNSFSEDMYRMPNNRHYYNNNRNISNLQFGGDEIGEENENLTGYTPGTESMDNPSNTIPSGDINMEQTPFPLLAIAKDGPDLGLMRILMSGQNANFKANKVLEFPLEKQPKQSKQNFQPQEALPLAQYGAMMDTEYPGEASFYDQERESELGNASINDAGLDQEGYRNRGEDLNLDPTSLGFPRDHTLGDVEDPLKAILTAKLKADLSKDSNGFYDPEVLNAILDPKDAIKLYEGLKVLGKNPSLDMNDKKLLDFLPGKKNKNSGAWEIDEQEVINVGDYKEYLFDWQKEALKVMGEKGITVDQYLSSLDGKGILRKIEEASNNNNNGTDSTGKDTKPITTMTDGNPGDDGTEAGNGNPTIISDETDTTSETPEAPEESDEDYYGSMSLQERIELLGTGLPGEKPLDVFSDETENKTEGKSGSNTTITDNDEEDEDIIYEEDLPEVTISASNPTITDSNEEVTGPLKRAIRRETENRTYMRNEYDVEIDYDNSAPYSRSSTDDVSVKKATTVSDFYSLYEDTKNDYVLDDEYRVFGPINEKNGERPLIRNKEAIVDVYRILYESINKSKKRETEVEADGVTDEDNNTLEATKDEAKESETKVEASRATKEDNSPLKVTKEDAKRIEATVEPNGTTNDGNKMLKVTRDNGKGGTRTDTYEEENVKLEKGKYTMDLTADIKLIRDISVFEDAYKAKSVGYLIDQDGLVYGKLDRNGKRKLITNDVAINTIKAEYERQQEQNRPSVGKYQFGGNINNAFSTPVFSSNLEDFGLQEIQTESGEMAFLPDGSVVNVKANKKHKDQHKDNVTDIFSEGTYVFSNDPLMRLSGETKLNGVNFKDLHLGKSVFKYTEGVQSPGPKKIMLNDMFFGKNTKKKYTTAQIADNIRKNIPLSEMKDDLFAMRSNEENTNQRLEYLTILKALNEYMAPERKEVPKAQYGMGFESKVPGMSSPLADNTNIFNRASGIPNLNNAFKYYNPMNAFNVEQKQNDYNNPLQNKIPTAQFGFIGDGIDGLFGISKRAYRKQQGKNAAMQAEYDAIGNKYYDQIVKSGDIRGLGVLGSAAASMNVPLDRYNDNLSYMTDAAYEKSIKGLEANKYANIGNLGGASSMVRFMTDPNANAGYMSDIAQKYNQSNSQMSQNLSQMRLQQGMANAQQQGQYEAGRNAALNKRDTQTYNAVIQGIGNVANVHADEIGKRGDARYQLDNQSFQMKDMLEQRAIQAKDAMNQKVRGYVNDVGSIALAAVSGGLLGGSTALMTAAGNLGGFKNTGKKKVADTESTYNIKNKLDFNRINMEEDIRNNLKKSPAISFEEMQEIYSQMESGSGKTGRSFFEWLTDLFRSKN